MKLFKGPDHSVWIGEDAVGALMYWPREPGGWARRSSYTGQRRILEEVEPALARGTGWPGGGRAPKPRSASGQASSEQLTLRSTPDEMEGWRKRAADDGKPLAVWGRDTLNAEAARPKKRS